LFIDDFLPVEKKTKKKKVYKNKLGSIMSLCYVKKFNEGGRAKLFPPK